MRDRKCVKFTDRDTSRRAVEWNERAEAAANRRGKGLEKGWKRRAAASMMQRVHALLQSAPEARVPDVT